MCERKRRGDARGRYPALGTRVSEREVPRNNELFWKTSLSDRYPADFVTFCMASCRFLLPSPPPPHPRLVSLVAPTCRVTSYLECLTRRSIAPRGADLLTTTGRHSGIFNKLCWKYYPNIIRLLDNRKSDGEISGRTTYFGIGYAPKEPRIRESSARLN